MGRRLGAQFRLVEFQIPVKQISKWKFSEVSYIYQFGTKRPPDLRVSCLEVVA